MLYFWFIKRNQILLTKTIFTHIFTKHLDQKGLINHFLPTNVQNIGKHLTNIIIHTNTSLLN